MRTLNMHLRLRAADVACAEAMWEWVAALQGAHRAALVCKGVYPLELALQDATRAALIELSRAEFDRLVMYFDWSVLHPPGTAIRRRCTCRRAS